MSTKKRAYVFQGPGLLRDGVLEVPLKALDFEIHHPFLMPEQAISLDFKLTRDDLVVFRGVWDPRPEEALYARQLGNKLRDFGRSLREMPANERPLVIAVGRWALALLFAEWTAIKSAEVSHLSWTEVPPELSGPWVEVVRGTSSLPYFARLKGRAFPDLAPRGFEAALKIAASSYPVGWCFESFLNLYFADPLAFGEGSQLESFGYENQENLTNSTTFLRNLIGSRHA